jgi:hypothetical protein
MIDVVIISTQHFGGVVGCFEFASSRHVALLLFSPITTKLPSRILWNCGRITCLQGRAGAKLKDSQSSAPAAGNGGMRLLPPRLALRRPISQSITTISVQSTSYMPRKSTPSTGPGLPSPRRSTLPSSVGPLGKTSQTNKPLVKTPTSYWNSGLLPLFKQSLLDILASTALVSAASLRIPCF